MPRNLIIAIGVIFFGIIAFDMMGIIVRILGDTYPILQIAAMRNFFGVIPALLLLAHAGQFSALPRLNKPRLHAINMLRSCSVVVAQLSFYTALTKVEFATAAALGEDADQPGRGFHIGLVGIGADRGEGIQPFFPCAA